MGSHLHVHGTGVTIPLLLNEVTQVSVSDIRVIHSFRSRSKSLFPPVLQVGALYMCSFLHLPDGSNNIGLHHPHCKLHI